MPLLPTIEFLQVYLSIYQNYLLLYVCTLHESLTTLLITFIWDADKPVIHLTSRNILYLLNIPAL